MNVTVRNVITSMRLISAVDWAEFFESVSLVDAELRAGSDFAAMDFPTRDRYRHAIEELARGSRHSELEVARRAIRGDQARGRRAARATASDRAPRAGSWLLPDRERAPRASRRSSDFACRCERLARRAPTARAGILGYLGTIAILTALILALPLLGAGAIRGRRSGSLAARAARPGPGLGRGAGAGEPPRHEPVRPEGAARPRASRRRAVEPAHDGRRAHPVDDASGDRGADRAARGSRVWRARTTISASRCSRTGRTPTARVRRATTSCSARPPRRSRG